MLGNPWQSLGNLCADMKQLHDPCPALDRSDWLHAAISKDHARCCEAKARAGVTELLTLARNRREGFGSAPRPLTLR
jgi:hypothetical protein